MIFLIAHETSDAQATILKLPHALSPFMVLTASTTSTSSKGLSNPTASSLSSIFNCSPSSVGIQFSVSQCRFYITIKCLP